MKTAKANWSAIVILVLIVAIILVMVWPSHASTTVLTGTVKDAQGNPINGTLVLQLPVPAQDTSTNTAVANTPVTCRLVNGAVTGCPPLYDVNTLNPLNLYYIAKAYDTSGAPAGWSGNFAITGGSYNLGAAVPTSITTNNISFVNPAVTGNSNVFCCTQTFQGQIVSTVAGGTAPFSVQSSTLVPNLNVNNLNNVLITNTPTTGQNLLATGTSTAAWTSSGLSGYKSECVNVTPVTVANTVALSPLQGCTIVANDIGLQSFYIDAFGAIGDAGPPTIQLCLYLDSTVLGCSNITLIAAAGQTWGYRGFFTGLSTGVTGTVTGASSVFTSNIVSGQLAGQGSPPSPNTINTTVSHTLQLQVQWGTASVNNTITSQSFTIFRVG